MSIEKELAELRAALELPTVGELHRGGDLAELERLVQRYTEEARAMYEQIHGPL